MFSLMKSRFLFILSLTKPSFTAREIYFLFAETKFWIYFFFDKINFLNLFSS
jgi:hypothetical protein